MAGMVEENLAHFEKILERARSEKFEVLNTWYSLFKLKEDPFSRQIGDDEIDYVVPPNKIIDSIIYDIGIAHRGIPTISLLVAPEGYGKSTICNYIFQIIGMLSERNPKYSFIGITRSAPSLFARAKDTDEMQDWTKASKQARDFIIIDDANTEHVRTIAREFTLTKFKLFAISPRDTEAVLSLLPVEPKIYFMKALTLELATEMLQKRMIGVHTEDERAPMLSDIFDSESLGIIHKNSFGVPRIILECCSKSLMLVRNMVVHSDKPLLPRVTAELAANACRLVKCLQAKEYESLSESKKDVIRRVMYEEKSPTEVAAEMGKDRTTVSRHLNELKESDLVTSIAHGRETGYRATLPVKILYEMEYMPKEMR